MIGIDNMTKALIGGYVYYKGRFSKDLVVIFNENIIDIKNIRDFDPKEVEDLIHLEEEFILPGFIDIHIHGYNGYDIMDGKIEALKSISKGLVKNGVTSYLGTTMTMEREKIEASLNNIRDYMENHNREGARIIGVHLEGPFINPIKKGAQSSEHIIDIDQGWIENHYDIIRIITLAPEINKGISFIEKNKDRVNISLGHSNADYDTSKKAFLAGAKGVTHLFNAMTSFNHRDPGLVGAALKEDLYVELIADNLHVNRELYSIILKQKDKDRILLVSDCIRAGGIGEGNFDLGGQVVRVIKNKCSLKDGTLAGSILEYNRGFENFSKYTSLSMEELVEVTSLNQAQYLGIDNITGSIEIGKWSNFTILDGTFNVVKTIVNGNLEYENI